MLQRNNIHLATCASGAVHATLEALRASAKTQQAKAKFILATDGQTLEAEDLISGKPLACEFPQFADHFTRTARSYLMRAGELNWKEINPDIFGSMIQAVADEEERGALLILP